MKKYIQLFILLFILFFIFTLVVLFSTCQKQSIEKKVQHEAPQDSLAIDSTKIKNNEPLYPPEPEGYKGIHQQEKEQHDQKK